VAVQVRRGYEHVRVDRVLKHLQSKIACTWKQQNIGTKSTKVLMKENKQIECEHPGEVGIVKKAAKITVCTHQNWRKICIYIIQKRKGANREAMIQNLSKRSSFFSF